MEFRSLIAAVGKQLLQEDASRTEWQEAGYRRRDPNSALAAPGRPGLHKIAKQFGLGSGTVQRIAAAANVRKLGNMPRAPHVDGRQQAEDVQLGSHSPPLIFGGWHQKDRRLGRRGRDWRCRLAQVDPPFSGPRTILSRVSVGEPHYH